jgi:prefoldin subunit 5
MDSLSDAIDSLETTLTDMLSLRRSIHEDLQAKHRRAVRYRTRAEGMLDGASGGRAAELQTVIESKEQLIIGYRDRIEGLTQQIRAIEKRIDHLDTLSDTVITPDPSVSSWQEAIDELRDCLQTEPSVNETADSQLNALLGEIDQLLEMAGVDVDTSASEPTQADLTAPEFPEAHAEVDDASESQDAGETALSGDSSQLIADR